MTTREPGAAAELPPYADLVLDVVERIPSGRVMAYGDVALALAGAVDDDGQPLGGGPRQVGRVMALYGGAVAWWRVVRADGSPAQGHEVRARAAWRREGTPLRAGGERVDMRAGRWFPDGAA